MRLSLFAFNHRLRLINSLLISFSKSETFAAARLILVSSAYIHGETFSRQFGWSFIIKDQ